MKRGSLVLSLICVLVISGCTSNLDKSGEKHRYNLVDPNDGWPAALFLEECDAQLQMIGDTNMNLVVNVIDIVELANCILNYSLHFINLISINYQV